MYTSETFTIGYGGRRRSLTSSAAPAAPALTLGILNSDLAVVSGLYNQLRGGGTAANLIDLWGQLASLLDQGQAVLVPPQGLSQAAATACPLLQNIIATVYGKIDLTSVNALASTVQVSGIVSWEPVTCG